MAIKQTISDVDAIPYVLMSKLGLLFHFQFDFDALLPAV
jgi:hypothetical protein